MDIPSLKVGKKPEGTFWSHPFLLSYKSNTIFHVILIKNYTCMLKDPNISEEGPFSFSY